MGIRACRWAGQTSVDICVCLWCLFKRSLVTRNPYKAFSKLPIVHIQSVGNYGRVARAGLGSFMAPSGSATTAPRWLLQMPPSAAGHLGAWVGLGWCPFWKHSWRRTSSGDGRLGEENWLENLDFRNCGSVSEPLVLGDIPKSVFFVINSVLEYLCATCPLLLFLCVSVCCLSLFSSACSFSMLPLSSFSPFMLPVLLLPDQGQSQLLFWNWSSQVF